MTRHLRWVLLSSFFLLATGQANAQQPPVQLRYGALESGYLNPKVPLAAVPQGVLKVHLKFTVDPKGDGTGEITLDPNTAKYNEVGDLVGVTEIAPVKKSYSIKYVKKAMVKAGPPGVEQEWLVFQIEAKDITARLHLITPNKDMDRGRLVISYPDGKVAYVVQLQRADLPVPPCHPGCFPAGTMVQTPNGAKPIESLAIGAVVTTIRSDGTTAPGKVQKVFITDNELLKVETDDGSLLTTQTQPLCLADGKPCPAGELQAGDHILRCTNSKVKAVKVLSVTPTGRKEKVFNLILGDSEMFIANGFLARSKPPAEATVSVEAVVLPGGVPRSKK